MLASLRRKDGFSVVEEEFDQERFAGRALKFVHKVDPRTLAPGLLLGMSLEEARERLNRFEREGVSGGVNAVESEAQQLWLAKKIVTSTVHPDTGDVVPAPFRMSGFVPFGTPIVVGMLVASTPAQLAVSQWLNQTHNGAVNYANRNMTAPVSSAELGVSYVVAAGSAVAICLGVDKLMTRFKAPTLLKRFVPFVAVASANVTNVTLMRRMELRRGIDVVDEAGQVVGRSVAAAQKALAETALTRVLLPVPVLVCSPLLMLAIERSFPALTRRPAAKVAVQASVVTLTFLFGLPLSLSIFRERGEILVRDLEPSLAEQVASLRDPPIQRLHYNKGL